MNPRTTFFSARGPSAALRQHFAACEHAVQWLDAANNGTLAAQVAIARVSAPTGGEGARAEWVQRALTQQSHAPVTRDAVGNVIATLPVRRDTVRADSAPIAPVVVMAHLDTVYEQRDKRPQGDRARNKRSDNTPVALASKVKVRRDGARYCAPGIMDNSRGLAAMRALHHVLQRPCFAALRTHPMEFVATVGEEGAGNLRGAKHYFDQRDANGLPHPIAVIALDGPGDSLVVHHAVSSARWRFVFDGPGGHPWVDTAAPNAVHAVGRTITAIARYADTLRSGATVSVARIGGGESLTSIPAHAWCEVDVRALDPLQCVTMVAQLHRFAATARDESTTSNAALPLHVRAELIGERSGGALAREHPLVQLAEQATQWRGVSPQSASASSDANVPLSRGIAAISIGAGGIGGGAHTANEWYEDVHGTRGVARAFAVISAAAAGLAQR